MGKSIPQNLHKLIVRLIMPCRPRSRKWVGPMASPSFSPGSDDHITAVASHRTTSGPRSGRHCSRPPRSRVHASSILNSSLLVSFCAKSQPPSRPGRVKSSILPSLEVELDISVTHLTSRKTTWISSIRSWRPSCD